MERENVTTDRWLYLKESGLYLNMNNVYQVDIYEWSVEVWSIGNADAPTTFTDDDAAKIKEWLDRRAYA